MKRDIAKFRAAYHSSAANYDNTAHLVTSGSGLPWISGGGAEEWVYIDLGAVSAIETVAVAWGEGYAAAYTIQFSEDGLRWRSAARAFGAAERTVETEASGRARYVRLLCEACVGARYVIRRVSVYGDNSLSPVLTPLPPPRGDGAQPLTGGNWKLRRASEVTEPGEILSGGGYDDSEWLAATVPGTVLATYLNAGAIPDPNYDDWQFQISDAYFTADFWYRDHVPIPAGRRGQRVFLQFDAINWKADVYFNSTFLKNALPRRACSIEGAFIRACFDVTSLVRFGEENHLAVRVHKNDTPGKVTTQGLAFGPGANGGLLGADNPTLHASVGWDWLPTVRGRNTGIYGDVTLLYGGDAALLDPWIETSLRLTGEQAAIPTEDLMLRSGVRVDGAAAPLRDWRGAEGDGFTVDFGEALVLGSATLLWGAEAGGAAADAESRHPDTFRLETSMDGSAWENFDAYPGGEVEAQWFGALQAAPNGGSAALTGHVISDSVQGSTAYAPVDLSMFGLGVENRPFFAPQKARYLRFTVLKRRALNGTPVDARLRALRVYAESPAQVEQNTKRSYLLDTARAALTFRAELENRSDAPVTAALHGSIAPDGPVFSNAYTLAPGERRPVEIPIVLDDPRLWWPNTYGEPFLYTAAAELRVNGVVSDAKTFRFGVRRFDYPIDGGLLALYCNGVRIVAKGGNWGIDDGMKRDTARVLDDKVRLHAEANMTMIRNWVGMTNHPGFYDACDRYGVLIWDDFWLANPVDGPEPADEAMFLENAADKIKRVRGHAALAFYCGRNEGEPGPALNEGLARLTRTLDGTRLYVPNSAAPPVGSGGGYSLAMPGGEHGVKQYFNDVSSPALRSERGIPNVPELNTLRKFLRPEHLWPINEVWALHDWTYHMNGPANTYMYALQSYLGGGFAVPEDRVQGAEPAESDPVYRAYRAAVAEMCREAGRAWTVEAFSRAAQLINYDNHRGMFDALAARRANGLLMWMSQSSWPSFMWQTYDYYLDTNGGYFGAKAGNQPTRAVFDPRNGDILLANATARQYRQVETAVEVFDLLGTPILRQTFQTDVLEPDAYGVRVAAADFSRSGTDLVFLRLTVRDGAGGVLGRNTYWHNRRTYQDHRGFGSLPQASVALRVSAREETASGMARFTVEVANGSVPALCARIRLLRADGAEILPVFYSDNYLTLMPGEQRTITAECDAARLRGEAKWEASGWNLPRETDALR